MPSETVHTHCPECLSSGTGDVLGQPCPRCHKGTISVEPTFSELVEKVDEPFWCPRRAENPHAAHQFPEKDRWQRFKKEPHDRVCSYCGSIHFDDLVVIVKTVAELPDTTPYRDGPAIELSDKTYKIYLHRPGIRNASQGAIKFYMQHVPRTADGKEIAVTDQQSQEYSEACRRSSTRFRKMLEDQRAGVA